MNKESKIGIVILPSLFGLSFAHTLRRWQLERLGYGVEVVDCYAGKTQPFFLSYVKSSPEENLKKMTELVQSLNEKELLDICREKIGILKKGGCEHLVLLGLGFGADLALRLIEVGERICASYMWYPHVIFPPGHSGDSLKEPRLDNLPEDIHIIIFHGGRDGVVVPGNAEKIARAFVDKKNKELVMFEKAGHAWDASFVQKFWPNPLWWKPNNMQAYYLSWGRVIRELASFSCNLGNHSDSK